MLLALGLGGSITVLLLQLIGFASAVQYPIDLGKFTYRKQRIVIGIIDFIFALSVLITYLLQPTAELLVCILFFGQIVVGFIYITVLNILCKKKFLRNIAEEVQNIHLDTNENLIVLRRQLMEQSDISCSIKELQKAIDLIDNIHYPN